MQYLMEAKFCHAPLWDVILLTALPLRWFTLEGEASTCQKSVRKTDDFIRSTHGVDKLVAANASPSLLFLIAELLVLGCA